MSHNVELHIECNCWLCKRREENVMKLVEALEKIVDSEDNCHCDCCGGFLRDLIATAIEEFQKPQNASKQEGSK